MKEIARMHAAGPHTHPMRLRTASTRHCRLAARAALCLALAPLSIQAAEPPGSIRGGIELAEEAAADAAPISVAAIDRRSNQRYAGRMDEGGRQFIVENLPLDSPYDLVIDFGTARLEGIGLAVPPSDYEEEQPLSPQDVETIEAKVRRMNKFEDVVEVLALEGNIQHAAILLNKLRTRPFYGSKPGEVVWRVELWHFERPEETWVKVQDELFVTLYRERMPRAAFDQKSITFDPSLGGLSPTSDQPIVELGTIRLPDPVAGIHIRKESTP